MVVLIDNYDSFSYNLYQLIGSFSQDIRVIRNDEITPEEVERLHPDYIILSPGPGRPEDSGICKETVLRLQGKIPILGVCLGHQAICQVYGGAIGYAKELMHGKQSSVTYQTALDCKYNSLFDGLGSSGMVGRYHSLSAAEDTLPDLLVPTSYAADGEIMSVQHREYPVYGLQFHPESILTLDGLKILENFLKIKI